MRSEGLAPKRPKTETDDEGSSASAPVERSIGSARAHAARHRPESGRSTSPLRFRHSVTRRLPVLLVAGGLALLAFTAGIAVGHFQIWPYRVVSKLYRARGSELAEARSEKEFKGLQPMTGADLRRVATPELVRERQNAISDYIWPGRGFPHSRIPDAIDVGAFDSVFPPSPNLLRITRFTTRMRANVESISYYLEPRNSKSCLMLYHHGHSGAIRTAGHTIERMLSAGCDVIAFTMPLTKGARAATVTDSVFGTVRLRTHNDLKLLEAKDFSPIAFFVEPVAAALNYVTRTRRFDRVGMLGLSGGGWATTLYAALDERVTSSYPVAGSEPLALMVRRREGWNDYEQTDMGLYRRASYPELYIMGTSSGRSQLQILNRFDSCCYYGRGYRYYEPAVAAVAKGIGGSFRIFLDESHREHKISDVAIDSVLADFFRDQVKDSSQLANR